jgi:hypothetical protein
LKQLSVSVRTVIKQFLGLSRLISGHVQKFADTNYTNVQPFLGLIIFIASKLFAAANIFIFSLNFSHQKMQRLLKFAACCKKNKGLLQFLIDQIGDHQNSSLT